MPKPTTVPDDIKSAWEDGYLSCSLGLAPIDGGPQEDTPGKLRDAWRQGWFTAWEKRDI